MLAGVRRVANGCGDENIRFVVVVLTGRFVGVVVVTNADVDVFIVVNLSMGIDDSEVVEMAGGDVGIVVIFGM